VYLPVAITLVATPVVLVNVLGRIISPLSILLLRFAVGSIHLPGPLGTAFTIIL